MKNITLNFLCHADFSGRLRKSEQNIGFPAFAAQVEALRSNNPEGTLLLDAGDAFSTNFWGGKPIVKALNMINTDVMTLGNHEFDRGIIFLEECIANCEFPVLCGNIIEKETGENPAGTLPYVILEKLGVKIGILGITSEYTPYMVEKTAFEPFRATSAIDCAKKYIPEMRLKGAEIIIALMHCPFYVEENNTISGELWDIFKEIPPVDVCIGGHIPGDFASIIGDTCVLKAGFGGESIGHAQLVFNTETRKVTAKSCEVIQTDPTGKSSKEIEDYIQSVVGPFESFFTEHIAQAEEHWDMRLAVESKLGDFLADCLRYGGNTTLSYMNATSAGGEIKPGIVTREMITQVAGFNDLIFTGKMTGKQLYQLVELVYEPDRFGNNAGIIFSGFHAQLDHTAKSPNKVLQLTLPDGTPIQPKEQYSVATSAYMASGGNDTELIANSISWKESDLRFYDAAFDYAKKIEVLSVKDWPRITAKGHPENDNSPF